jgi:hypothetical protein
MPISERRLSGLAAAATLLLAAGGLAQAASAGPATSTRVNVAGQRVTIAAPPGFCVDQKSTTMTTAGAFVLMSDCSLLGGARSGKAPIGAALTASVSNGGIAGEGDSETGSLDELEDFAATPDGRAVLGRSGQPDRVRVLSKVKSGDVLYLLIEDRGKLPVAGINGTFWRAFLDVNGRMVALSELGFEGGGMDRQQALNELAALAAAIRAANPPGRQGGLRLGG